MTRRLLHIAAPVKGTLAVSTLASIIGNLAQMGLMGFGALMLMSCAGIADGSPITYGVLAAISAALIVAGRYTEGVVSHGGRIPPFIGHAHPSFPNDPPSCARLPHGRKRGIY